MSSLLETVNRVVAYKPLCLADVNHMRYPLPAHYPCRKIWMFLPSRDPLQELQPGSAPCPLAVGVWSGDDELRLEIGRAIL